MVGEVQLDEDKEGKAVDPSQQSCKKDLSVSKKNRTSGSLWYPKFILCTNTFEDADHAWLSRIHAVALLAVYQLLGDDFPLDETQLTDYGFVFNKVQCTVISKALLPLCCKLLQHSRSKHIDISSLHQGALLRKALGRERIEFSYQQAGGIAKFYAGDSETIGR
ncbi:hypothetical protein Tco_0710122 [Tanacetum coccineum]